MVGSLRLSEVTGWGSDERLVSLLRRGRDIKNISVLTHTERMLCEDPVRRQLCEAKEEVSPETSPEVTPILDFWPPEQ